MRASIGVLIVLATAGCGGAAATQVPSDLERARSAYLACARNVIQPATMHHWSVFCAKRADRLPPRRFVPTEEGTTVTVSIDY